MDRPEYEARNSTPQPRRVPLVAVGPTELVADGFNYRERDVRLSFRLPDHEANAGIDLVGAVRHSGRRIATVSDPPG